MKKIWVVASALFIGLLVALGLLLRPPTQINGVSTSFGTISSAESQVEETLALKTVFIGDREYTYEELGVSLKPGKLQEVLGKAYLFLPSSWKINTEVPYQVDSKILESALNSNPKVFPPRQATVEKNSKSFILEEGSEGYTVSPGKLLEALGNGDSVIELEPIAPLSTEIVLKELDRVNKIIESGIPVMVGDEEVGRLDGSELIKAYSITTQEESERADMVEGSGVEDSQSLGQSQSLEEGFVEQDEINDRDIEEDDSVTVLLPVVSIDPQPLIETVSAAASKEAISGSAIVDGSGNRLLALVDWQDGFSVDSDALPAAVEEALENGEDLIVPGEVVPAKVEEHFREAVVKRGERRAYFYENGVLVNSFPVAIGKTGWETTVGEFSVDTQLATQDMGCNRPDLGYCTEDVPWVTYFNGDQGFHGAYWHNDFGDPAGSAVSHGCVNMAVEDAKWVYDFLTIGTPVKVEP